VLTTGWGGTCQYTHVSVAGRAAQAGGLKKESISPPGKKNDLRRGALTSSLSKELNKQMTPKKLLHGPEAFDNPREVRDRWRVSCTALGVLWLCDYTAQDDDTALLFALLRGLC